MRYLLKAVSHAGRVEALEVEGFDAVSVIQQAENRGYAVLAARRRWAPGLLLPGARARFPVGAFSQDLLVLLDAGLPLVEAIQTLAERERRGETRALLERVSAVVREGQPLSAALKQLPQAFPPLYVATVQASETTGDLSPALARYVAYQSQIDAVRRRLLAASIYPALLVAAGGLVSLFLLFYVVPRFGSVFEERGVGLPFFSRLLFWWGQLIRGHGALAAGACAALAAAAACLLARPAARARLADLVWRLPAVGERVKLYQLARFYRTIGMLLRSGVPLVSALRMGSELLHAAWRSRLAAAVRAIDEGLPIAASMEANGMTTPVAQRLLAIGEQSGRMGEMMERIAAFHDEEISRWIDWSMRLLEPLLMTAIGLAIGAVVILMYMPIFELAEGL